ncbi:MAG TPA: ABC transporter substrate-binding protein [Amycolatopsis sp.]|nr:ABC transporter substrate-binding protein [Amycolatopsis sp.]
MGFDRARSRTHVVLAASVAAAMMVAGCAGSGSDSGAGNDSGKQLLIGENTIISGTAAASYAITQGFEAYLKYVNDHGGVNGYTFRWEARDNAYSPSQSATVQGQLLAEDPFAISVIGTVPVTSAAQVSINSSSDVPLLVAADGAQVTSLSNQLKGGIFGYVPDYTKLGPYDAQFIIETLHDKNFALAFENDSLAQGAAGAIANYVTANGAKLAANVPMAATTTDFTPLATQLKSSGAKTVLSWANAGVTAGLQKAAAQIGYTPQWVTPFFALSQGYLQLAGAAGEGTYIDGVSPPPTDTGDPAVKTFVDATTAYAKPATTGSGQQGWELAAVLVQGIRQATANGQALTKENFKAAVKQINTKVEMSQLDYRAQNWGATQAGMFQVKSGQFVSVKDFTKLPGL